MKNHRTISRKELSVSSNKWEFDCSFILNEVEMKGNFGISKRDFGGKELVIIEARKISKKSNLSLTNLWNEAKKMMPFSSAALVMYNRRTGEIVLYNEVAKMKFGKEMLKSKMKPEPLTVDNFLPYVIDRKQVSRMLEALKTTDRFQTTTEVKIRGVIFTHFIMLRKVPNSAEDLILCYEEEASCIGIDIDEPPINVQFMGLFGMSELLVENALCKELPESAELLRNYAGSLLKIINMFELGRMQNGVPVTSVQKEMNLIQAVEDSLDFLSSLAAVKRLEMASQLPVSLPERVFGDLAKIKQVLLNLIANAIAATTEGDILVRVKLEGVKDQHLSLFVEVADTGCGLTGQQTAKIFHDVTSVYKEFTANPSTPLGLAVTRALVESMGGRLGVQSKVGEGSKFWFTLTLKKASEPIYSSIPKVFGTKALIVATEKERLKRQVLFYYLSEWGFIAQITPTASEALGVLEGAKETDKAFELVLISTEVPDLPVPTFVEAIKCIDANIQTITIAPRISGFNTIGFPFRLSEMTPVLARFGDKRQGIRKLLTPAVADNVINVLIAEDNKLSQVFTAKILEKMGGFKIDIVYNGLDAVEKYRTGSYDLILMDCKMPELDGFQTTKKIRELEKETADHVVIIALTGMSSREDREECLRVGMDDFVSKPVTSKELLQKIEDWRKHLELQKAERQLGNTVPKLSSDIYGLKRIPPTTRRQEFTKRTTL